MSHRLNENNLHSWQYCINTISLIGHSWISTIDALAGLESRDEAIAFILPRIIVERSMLQPPFILRSEVFKSYSFSSNSGNDVAHNCHKP
jgi:hypothetical protein